MHRAFVEKTWMDSYLDDEHSALPHEVEMRFFKILRIKPQEKVAVFDGLGRQVSGILAKDGHKAYFIKSELCKDAMPKPAIVLMQAAIEEPKMSETIKRGTEFGVDKFVIFNAEYSERYCYEKLIKRHERLKLLAIDACRQSGRLFVPQIIFYDSLSMAIAAKNENSLGFFGDPGAKDLLSDDVLTKKLEAVLKERNVPTTFSDLFSNARSFGERLKPFLCDTGEIIEDFFKRGQKVLFEGAQGALLDVDHGTYPFVTSSNCVAAQASIGSGIGMKWLDEVWLVSKAYCTRVGEGPFFTEVSAKEQDHFRNIGNEFGATTGRPRRCGWLDLVALKYAARINGATGLILTKVDILSELKEIKVGTGYRYKNSTISFSDALELYQNGQHVEVEYLNLAPMESFVDVKKLSDLPKSAQIICELIEKHADMPVKMISFGKERGQELLL